MKSIGKILKRILLVLLLLIVAISLLTFLYMRKSIFGKAPAGERLELLKKSPNYKDGAFQNLSETPQLAEGYSMSGVMWDFLFSKTPKGKPMKAIPSIKTAIKGLDASEDILIWFGHSSYYIQLDGVKILVDPVFSGNASPVPGSTKSFEGTDVYTVDDLPEIDYLFISHDHYDHLDYKTVLQLQPKVKKVVCGLGVGSHFEAWGYDTSQIDEKDWNDTTQLAPNFTAFVRPARHFSGRTFKRNNTLWCSYVLQASTFKIYIGGDSGYDTHFAEIGKEFGPIDLAILENGQYNEAWRYIHTLPDEFPQAAKDLNAKKVFPVHSGKFKLALHAWDEPLQKATENFESLLIDLVTPKIGEVVYLKGNQSFSKWWESLD